MTFAELLKKAIDENGLSVAKVAANSGLSRETVYAILRGTTPNPGWETIRDLLKALPKTKPKEFFPRERTRSTAHKKPCARLSNMVRCLQRTSRQQEEAKAGVEVDD